MPKRRRKIEVDPDLLRKYLDLVQRAKESDRKTAEVLADVHQFRKYLHEKYGTRRL